MKTKKIAPFLLSLFLGMFIFLPDSSTATSLPGPEKQIQNNSIKKDGEIIATLIAINKNEIALAQEALKKATHSEVIHYAQMLKKQHTQNLNALLKLSQKIGIAPVKTAKVRALQKHGAKELKTLSALKGNRFEKAYIQAMIKGHTDVLNLFDKNLLKNVSNASLKKFLLTTRPHIASHLQQAQKIQHHLD